MRVVKLWELSGAALIVPEKTGVHFTNQVNGNACEHPYQEGILIPINNDCFPEDPQFLETQLCQLFDGEWNTITEDMAKEIDRILSRFPETKGISVDQSQ